MMILILNWPVAYLNIQTQNYLHPDLSESGPERFDTVRRLQLVSNQTIQFMEEVINLISGTTYAWKTFCEGDRKRFFNLPFSPESDSPSRLLSGIDSNMVELGRLCREVQTRKQFVERREQEVRPALPRQ
jgi:hypothetical protein